MTSSAQTNASGEGMGIIGRVYENDRPVIYKFVDELPSESIRAELPWLVVISWQYDGSADNGMPSPETNQSMSRLEETVDAQLAGDGFLRHVYSRTGNNLKEFVYYIHDRDAFIGEFNRALEGHARYPLEIGFYEDREWEDFGRVLADFSQAGS